MGVPLLTEKVVVVSSAPVQASSSGKAWSVFKAVSVCLIVGLLTGGAWKLGWVQFSLTANQPQDIIKKETVKEKVSDEFVLEEGKADVALAAQVEKLVLPPEKVEARKVEEEKPPVVADTLRVPAGRRDALAPTPVREEAPVAEDVQEFSVKDYITAWDDPALAKDLLNKKIRLTGTFLNQNSPHHLCDQSKPELWTVHCDFARPIPSALLAKEYEGKPMILVTVTGVCQDAKTLRQVEMVTSAKDVTDRFQDLKKAKENSFQRGFELAEEEVRQAKKVAWNTSLKAGAFVKFTGEVTRILPVDQGVIMIYLQDPKKKSVIVWCKFRLAHREEVDKLFIGQLVKVCGLLYSRDENRSALKVPMFVNCYFED